MAGIVITMLIPTAALEDLNNDSEMWNIYLSEVNEEDHRITNAWKEDANSIVTFVSFNQPTGLCVSLSDKLQDGSILSNCGRIHH